MWSHEESYKYIGVIGFIHRSRLRKILTTFNELNLPESGKFADFGCSNGYIISLLKERIFSGKSWEFYGFDYEEKLLTLARKRGLENTQFLSFNLNLQDGQLSNRFDIVTSFETLEHVGNPENAFTNLYNACKQGGQILFTIPNEKGLPGIIKFIGRGILRKSTYRDFFKNESRLNYLCCLLLNKPINSFRTRNVEGWAEHLGFDWKLFEGFINNEFIKSGKCTVLHNGSICLGFNRLYFLEKSK